MELLILVLILIPLLVTRRKLGHPGQEKSGFRAALPHLDAASCALAVLFFLLTPDIISRRVLSYLIAACYFLSFASAIMIVIRCLKAEAVSVFAFTMHTFLHISYCLYLFYLYSTVFEKSHIPGMAIVASLLLIAPAALIYIHKTTLIYDKTGSKNILINYVSAADLASYILFFIAFTIRYSKGMLTDTYHLIIAASFALMLIAAGASIYKFKAYKDQAGSKLNKLRFVLQTIFVLPFIIMIAFIFVWAFILKRGFG